MGVNTLLHFGGTAVLIAAATRNSGENVVMTRPMPDHLMLAVPSLGAGGSERVISHLANHWAEAGRRITIVTFDAPSFEPYYALHPAIRVVKLALPALSKPLAAALLRTGRRIHALRRVLREQEPDVVISFLTKMNIMMLQAARGTGIPVVISERNNPYLQRFGPMWSRARALSYPRAHSFVTMTQRAADFYPEAQRPRLTLIPNPVALPPGWRDRREGDKLVAVGRLDPQKRFDRLIDAFSRIAEQIPQWSLVIWGEGPERARLEAQRDALGLAGRVRLPGTTPAPGTWVETVDVFVLSSEFEGWANVIMEAMAAGLPVVSFDCPFGPREMIEDGESGILVENGSVDALAEAVLRVVKDEDLQRRLGAAAARTSERFAMETVAAQWEAVAASAAESGRTRRAQPAAA